MKAKIFIALIAALVGYLLAFLLSAQQSEKDPSAEQLPLYWVAPMDPNYRRDKPGKSPMGMDLVPVYEEEASSESPGTITISPEIENNLGVRIAEVELKKIQPGFHTVGTLKYNEEKFVHIHPRVEGWVDTLFVKAEGNPVKAGDPLYTLYSPTLVNAQEELLLALNSHDNYLIDSAIERMRALQISQQFIETFLKDKKVKRSVLFHAPQEGVMDQLRIREGFFVQPGTTMMSIGSLEEIWAEVDVFEKQLSLVSTGMQVIMQVEAYPGKEWQGRVDYIYPALNAQTRTLRLRLRFDNPGELLRPNMYAEFHLLADELEALVIPREALIRLGHSNRVVLALGKGKYKSIEVKVGRHFSEEIEIVEGLQAGEKIVSSAQFLLDSESSITSDFKRMQKLEEAPSTVSVEASIDSVDIEGHALSLSHGPIEAWSMAGMTMRFPADEDLALDTLQKGDNIIAEIFRTEDFQYRIVAIQRSEK